MYRMILPETLPDVAAAEAHAAAEPGGSVDVPTVDVRAVDADAAAARTRADYGRVSRWALGLLGTAGAAVAVLIAVFPLSLVGTAGTGQVLFGAVFVAIALAIGIPSVWLLWALHRSGRRLSRAAGYWAGLPYRQGRRSPARGDWFAVRFLGFSSDLFLRLICSTLSGSPRSSPSSAWSAASPPGRRCGKSPSGSAGAFCSSPSAADSSGGCSACRTATSRATRRASPAGAERNRVAPGVGARAPAARVSLDVMSPEAIAQLAPELASRIVADSRDRVGWMRARSRGITATDVAQLTSHTSIARAADAKLGAGRGFSGNAYTDHGRRREPEIAAWVAATHGIHPSSALFHAVVEKRHLATPDGIAVDAAGRVSLAEIKTTNKTWRSIPRTYLRQVWWQQHVLGAERTLVVWEEHDGFVPVGDEPRCAWVDRDEREIGQLVRLATELIDELYRRTVLRHAQERGGQAPGAAPAPRPREPYRALALSD